MSIFESASIQHDSHGHVRQLNHLDAPYRMSSSATAANVELEGGITPRALADQYLHDAMPHMGLSEALFTDRGASTHDTNVRERLVYHDEKQVTGNATVTYNQTIDGIPVWESGVAVQVEMAPMQVIGSQSSVKMDLDVQMPPTDGRFQQSRLDANTLKKLFSVGQRMVIDISHKEPFIYQFRAANRLDVHHEGPAGQADPRIPFALPPGAKDIADGHAYMVTAVQFTVASGEAPESGWLALIEIQTGSVLLLRSLAGCVLSGVIDGHANVPLAAAHDPPANAAATGPHPVVVFFDVGDTLGKPVFSASGNLARIEIFPAAMEVVKELTERDIRVGIITDPGGLSQDLIISLLQDTGIFEFVDRDLVVQGAKNNTAIFTTAANLAGVTPESCLFVGENSAERIIAASAGFHISESPDRTIMLVDPLAALAWVYLTDPRTKAGASAPAPNANGQELDRYRDLVSLTGLTTVPAGTIQTLRGRYVRIQDVELPSPTLPSSPAPGDFRFSVNTNDFGATNAYHNCDRVFRVLQNFGIDVEEYFDGTTFPVRVDPRIQFEDAFGVPTANSVNASAPGFRFPPSSDGFRFALAALNTSVGMAADWRVVLHEFGHALLWDHVGSPNFNFAHSAGDALAAILNDVDNRASREITFPWVGINRSHTRPVSQFAWYGTLYDPFGPGDRAGYVAEQMLSSTLFGLYLSAGGGSTNRDVQDFAANYVAFLIIKSIGLMSTTNNPATPEGYADLLMQADTGEFQFRGISIPIGVLRKVIRWAFEMQGAYRQPPADGVVTNQIGSPPQVDVFINDGRDGQYSFIETTSSADIWNRRLSDGGGVHQNPIAGQKNFAYVRVSNRGLTAATNLQVRAFQSSLSANRAWPTDWDALDNSVLSFPTPLQAGQSAIVGPFQWVPSSMTPTLLMSASATGDASNLGRFTNANPVESRRLVPLDNNIAQRTLTAVAHA